MKEKVYHRKMAYYHSVFAGETERAQETCLKFLSILRATKSCKLKMLIPKTE